MLQECNKLGTVACQLIHYSRRMQQQSLDFKICWVLKLDTCKYCVVKGRCNIVAEEPQIVYDLYHLSFEQICLRFRLRA